MQLLGYDDVLKLLGKQDAVTSIVIGNVPVEALHYKPVVKVGDPQKERTHSAVNPHAWVELFLEMKSVVVRRLDEVHL